MATKKQPLGAQIDEIWQLREQKRGFEEQAKKVSEQIEEKEKALLERFDAEGIEKGTGQHATISVGTSVRANIVDWDSLCAFIKKTNSFQLLQHRVSDLSAREFFERGKKVPGLEAFTHRKLNIRSTTPK